MKRTTKLTLLVIGLAATASSSYLILLNQPAAGAEHTVTIPPGAFMPPGGQWQGERIYDERYFSPNTVKIKLGDFVRWVNRDSVTHTVTSEVLPAGGQAFDAVLSPGGSFRARFTRAGEYRYYCAVHPWQGGKIIVEP
jgi:hypothetical protein